MLKPRLAASVRAGKSKAAEFTAPSPEGPPEPSIESADRAQASLNNLAMVAVSLIVALTVGAIVAAFLLPIAIDELVAVDTSTWGQAADAMWGILDAIIVLAAFLFFVAVALGAADRV